MCIGGKPPESPRIDAAEQLRQKGAVPTRAQLLRRAESLTCGPREKDYGPPAKSFARVASLWSAYLGVEITAGQVCMCLALLKLARTAENPRHMDSHDDAAGYVALAYECVTETKP